VTAPRNRAIAIGDVKVVAGRRKRFDIPVARLPTGSLLSMPVAVLNGRGPGPTVWLSGAIHGDELNGVEIIRQVLPRVDVRTLRGAIIATPVVNVFGFIEQSRYLPDGRDLNRFFPGSARGSLASRLAKIFMTEVVAQSDLGIDLHTAAGHRINIPQIRADLDHPETLRLSNAFGAPYIIDARLRDGSLRMAATKRDVPVLLYEAGQIHRFDSDAITYGVEGVLRVLQAMEMGSWELPRIRRKPIRLASSRWVRARRSGIATLAVTPGEKVGKGSLLGRISDAFGHRPTRINAPFEGHVIAITQNPLVSQGDALVHIGQAHSED
jgi:predicted deacylase